MPYPSASAARSTPGAASPSYPTTTLSSSYIETTFTIADGSTWREVGTNGQATANPLGTSGTFTVVVDFGTTSEEHILCSAINTSTGVITIWTDGTRNGRGWNGTPISAHSTGSSSNKNCFPFIGGTDFAAINSIISTLSTTYAPLNNASIGTTAAGSIPLIASGTTSQTASIQEWRNSAGSTLMSVSPSGVLTLASQKVTGIANGTASTDAVSYGQWIAQTLTPVVKTISNTASAGEFVIMNGSGNTTTTLPTTPANGTMVGLLNVGTGTASIAAGGSDTIRGSTTSGAGTSSSQYQTLVVSYNSASGVWEQVVADANKGYLSRTNSWVGANTFGNTVTNNATTTMGHTTSTTGPSLTVKQPVQTATVTAASGNGTTVTYTANNSFTVGNNVSISGLGIASGSSLNLTLATIATASSTQFTVTNTTVGVSSGTGTATSYVANQYAFQVQNAGGSAVFQTGSLGTAGGNVTNLTESLNHTGSFIRVAGAPLQGSLTVPNYNSVNWPALTVYQNGALTGDLISLRNTTTNTVLRANTAGAWITGGGTTSFVVRAVQNTAAITAISGNGTTITVTANHYFNAGQTVVITGTTNYNGTYTIASTPTNASFTITSATTGATSTGTATTTGQTADILAVQDSNSTALFGISNTGTAGSPVWVVNAYNNKITNVANGSASTDAVAFGQLSSYAPLVSPSFTTPSLGVATATSINGTSIPSSATLVTTSTTSLPSVTSVNGTTIPSSATLLVSGGALGTPSSGTLTNATGLPISTGVSGLGTGVATFLATPTSANLASVVSDETGSGSLVFSTLPTFGGTGIQLSGSTSGTSTLKAQATAGTTTFTLPTTTGTLIGSGDTATVSNTMLANSAVTVNGVSISLGGSGTVTAAAGTLTGATLNSTVLYSSLTQVGLSSAGFVKSDASGNLSVDTNTYLTSTTGVTTFSGGTTGLLPSSATSGAVTLSGTLAVGNGGTGVTTSTGSGSNVLSNSPSLTTPSLGAATATSINGTTIPSSATLLTTTSTITLNGTSVTLSGTNTIKASTTNALTISTGLSGTSFDGSAAVTIAIDSTVTTNSGSQTLTNKTLTAPVITYSVNAQTGTTFTPGLTDAAALVTLSNGSAISVTIPTNGSIAYAIGTQLNFIQIGTGQVTISAATPGTTTIASNGATSASPKLRTQYSSASAIKVGTDLWYVVGDIV